jgi:hypothetical protein
MKSLIISMLFSSFVFAQYSEQPAKESNEDLRHNHLIFSLEESQDNAFFALERTPALGHYLRYKKNDEVQITKVDSADAQGLDMNFARHFLKIQYEIPTVEGDCKVTLRLNLKGEKQEVCEKDEKKTQELATFLKELKKRF